MSFQQKLKGLRDAVDAMLEEFDEEPPQTETILLEKAGDVPSDIVLLPTKRNRRSEKNEVLTLAETDGAPSMPANWLKYCSRTSAAWKLKKWLYEVLNEYEPMGKDALPELLRATKPGLARGKGMRRFYTLVSRMMEKRQIKINAQGHVVIGKGD